MNTNIQPNQNSNPENITPRQIVYVVIGLLVAGLIFYFIKASQTPKAMDPRLPSQIDQQIFNKSSAK